MLEKIGVNFGHIIAYLVPGFLAIYPLAEFVPHFGALIGQTGVPKAEALIPLLLVALAVGIAIDAVSWALLRPLIGLTGVRRPPELTYAALTKDDVEIHNSIIENNFRYHQFYANMFIAVLLHAHKWLSLPIQEHGVRNGAFVLVTGVLFFAARDSLNRAYTRMLALTTKEGTTMTNGDPHHAPTMTNGDPNPSKPKPQPNSTPANPKTQPSAPGQLVQPSESGTQPNTPQK